MDNLIDYTDFSKIKLKVGQIIEAEEVPKTDKLVRLTIDLNDEKRQIVAGIKSNYKPEDLIDKKIAVVCNLKPRSIRGYESQGMLLAASNDDHSEISILTVDKDIPNGSIIK